MNARANYTRANFIQQFLSCFKALLITQKLTFKNHNTTNNLTAGRINGRTNKGRQILILERKSTITFIHG